MNTKTLSKQYRNLSTLERLRMRHAANQRGDTVEVERINQASPRRHFSMNDAGELENALIKCATVHFGFQMQTAAEMWQCLSREADAHEAGDDESSLGWLCLAILAETNFAVERDGWSLFLDRNGFDETLITPQEMLDSWFLGDMNANARIRPEAEETLRTLAQRPNVDEVVRRLAEEPIRLRTAEDVAADWEQFLPR